MSLSFNLEDRVVLVTGGTKGIGRAIALEFLNAGAKVAVTSRAQGVEAPYLWIQSDATEEASVDNAIKETINAFGQLDILVNNVGGAIKFGSFFDLTKEDWQNAFDLNVQSMVSFSKLAIPYLKKSKTPRIINISSITGQEPGYFNPHYSAAKAATINLSKHLANILASDKILVNCVSPGSIYTEAWVENMQQVAVASGKSFEEIEPQFMATETAKIPLGKIGQGKDVAKMVLFLASDEAAWITGSSFHINGGKMRSI